MKWLLDTVTVSQGAKPQPNPGVVNWLARHQESDLYLSAVTLAEVQFGIARMPTGRKKELLSLWFDGELPRRFLGRILDVDSEVARLWGTVCGELAATGRSLPLLDSLIGATALQHGLIVVTRDEAPFRAMGVPVENPWS